VCREIPHVLDIPVSQALAVAQLLECVDGRSMKVSSLPLEDDSQKMELALALHQWGAICTLPDDKKHEQAKKQVKKQKEAMKQKHDALKQKHDALKQKQDALKQKQDALKTASRGTMKKTDVSKKQQNGASKPQAKRGKKGKAGAR
jgi:hypothetical protein